MTDFYSDKKLFEVSEALGKAVKEFTDAYDKEMTLPASFDRGSNIAKLLNSLQDAYVLWWIEIDSLRKSRQVDRIIEESKRLHNTGG